MYHLWRNEMYRLGDNAPKSYVVHRRLTKESGKAYFKRRVVTRVILTRQVVFVIESPFPLPRVHIHGRIPNQPQEILRMM